MIQFPDPVPQYKFDPLNVDPWSEGAGAPTVVHPTGYPYDLIEELPREGGAALPITTSARGGAVHYKNSKPPGLDYPPIDRAFYFTANDNDVGVWGFWGEDIDYAFKTITTSSSVKTELWTLDANDYLALVVQDNESSSWGYIADGQQNWRIRATDDISKMELWADSTYASISIEGGQSLWTATGDGGRVRATTADLEGKTASFQKRVYVKNVELSCEGLEVDKVQSIFLVTPEEPPPDDEYTPPAHHCDHAKIHDIVHNALIEAGVHGSHGTHHEEHMEQHHGDGGTEPHGLGHNGHHGPAHNAGHSAGHAGGHGNHHGNHPSAHAAGHRAGHNNHHTHNHGSAHNAGHSAGHSGHHNNHHTHNHGSAHNAGHSAGHSNHHTHNHGSAHNAGHSAGHSGHHGNHPSAHSAGHNAGHSGHHGNHPSAHSAGHNAGHSNHHTHNHGSAHNAGHTAGHHSNHSNGHSNHHGGGHEHGSTHHSGGHSCCDHLNIDCQDGEITVNGQ